MSFSLPARSPIFDEGFQKVAYFVVFVAMGMPLTMLATMLTF